MSLYERDFNQWVNTQAAFLKMKNYQSLDTQNLIQEIEDLGKREKQMLTSYIEKWLLHMLKCRYQPGMHTRSWDLSIKIHQHKAECVLKENPSLKPVLQEIFDSAYIGAILEAAQETGLSEEVFPTDCPWTPLDIFPDLESKYHKE